MPGPADQLYAQGILGIVVVAEAIVIAALARFIVKVLQQKDEAVDKVREEMRRDRDAYDTKAERFSEKLETFARQSNATVDALVSRASKRE